MAVRQSQARRSEIVRLAKTSGLASVDDLSTSSASPRRPSAVILKADLRVCSREPMVAPSPSMRIPSRRSDSARSKDSMPRAIAKWAASQVLPGETVLLDAGTTVGAMGEFLRETERLTVITAKPTALEALADADDVRVECLGGTLRHLSQGFLGPLTGSCACPSNLRPRFSAPTQ